MGMLDDIMKTLDRWEVWRTLQMVPARTEALERRVSELEDKLGGKWPPDVCRYCGERASRLHQSYQADAKGIIKELWHCSACNKYEDRAHKVK